MKPIKFSPINLALRQIKPNILVTLLIWIASLFYPHFVQAEVLNQVTIVAPASPITSPSQLNISALKKYDAQKEIWVTYSLVAVSELEKPSGKIVIEAMPEGVMVPMSDTKVVFSADDMNLGKTSGQFKQAFEKEAGVRPISELNETFGVNLTKAIIAMKENKGAVLTQNITKHYPAPGKNDLRLLTSFEKIEGIQPAIITITMGQGDIPTTYQKDFAGKTGSHSRLFKTILGLLALLVAAVVVYQKFKE